MALLNSIIANLSDIHMMRTLRIIYICNILFYIFNILSTCILVTIISTTSSLSSQQLTFSVINVK